MTKVALCCGVGGTGKTTLSAALALSFARAGERVVVVTIDPARRLADALGVEALDNEPRAVDIGGPGTLHALMLDRKATWDEVVRRHASPGTAERLLANRYYRALSTRLSGSHEYMAVEKLHDLVGEGRWDRVVVDTPPTEHAIDFFRAPERVRAILDRSMLRILVDPGSSISGVAARAALAILHRVAGEGVMGDLRDFFTLVGAMSSGFRERAAQVAAVLGSSATRTWLVTDADAPDRDDLLGFLEELRSRRMTFAGFFVNRLQAVPTGPFPAERDLLAADPGIAGWTEIVAELAALPIRARDRAAAQRQATTAFVREAGGAPAWLVPELPGGVRTIDGLSALAAHLPPRPAAEGPTA